MDFQLVQVADFQPGLVVASPQDKEEVFQLAQVADYLPGPAVACRQDQVAENLPVQVVVCPQAPVAAAQLVLVQTTISGTAPTQTASDSS